MTWPHSSSAQSPWSMNYYAPFQGWLLLGKLLAITAPLRPLSLSGHLEALDGDLSCFLVDSTFFSFIPIKRWNKCRAVPFLASEKAHYWHSSKCTHKTSCKNIIQELSYLQQFFEQVMFENNVVASSWLCFLLPFFGLGLNSAVAQGNGQLQFWVTSLHWLHVLCCVVCTLFKCPVETRILS